MAWIPRLLAEAHLTQYSIPAFLCPTVLRLVLRRGRICQSRLQTRSLQLQTADTPRKASPLPSHLISLPRTCPGCGAFTQITNPHKAGFYNLKRKSVNAFLAQQGLESRDGDSTTRNPDLGLAETRVLRDLDCNRRLPHISFGMFGTLHSKVIISTLTCKQIYLKRPFKPQFATAVMIYYIIILGLPLSIQRYSQFAKSSQSHLINTITSITSWMRRTSLYHLYPSFSDICR